MSKHTPGPWRIGDDVPAPANVIVVVDDAYGWVARVAGDDVDAARANARLIAAAPDMLEALRTLADASDGVGAKGYEDGWRNLRSAIGIARAAIAKAQGREP